MCIEVDTFLSEVDFHTTYHPKNAFVQHFPLQSTRGKQISPTLPNYLP